TLREAGFILLVAAFGYFLRRQFNAFTGKECGAIGEAFIRRAIANGHVAPHRLGTRTILYHLCGRPVYAALGNAEDRNRREHAVITVKRRVMALDFMLDSARQATTADKQVELFRKYASAEIDEQAMNRLGSERWPVYETTEGLGIAYVDEGA